MNRNGYRQYCGLARALDVAGDRWTLLIVAALLGGEKRFNELQEALDGIAPNILSARLRDLVEHGLLEKVPLPEGARHEYRLTGKGRDFFPAYLALKA